MPVSPGPGRRRALRLGLAEDGWRAGGSATVPLAECRGGADGSAPAECPAERSTHGDGQHQGDESRDRGERQARGLAVSKLASVRPRAGRGPGRGRDLPPGAVCDSGRCYRRWWRRYRNRDGQGIGRTARARRNCPQVIAQPACVLRDLGRATRRRAGSLATSCITRALTSAGTDPGQRRHRVVACAHATSGGSPTKGGARPGYVSDYSQRIQSPVGVA